MDPHKMKPGTIHQLPPPALVPVASAVDDQRLKIGEARQLLRGPGGGDHLQGEQPCVRAHRSPAGGQDPLAPGVIEATEHGREHIRVAATRDALSKPLRPVLTVSSRRAKAR
jgi:hypothetical protein